MLLRTPTDVVYGYHVQQEKAQQTNDVEVTRLMRRDVMPCMDSMSVICDIHVKGSKYELRSNLHMFIELITWEGRNMFGCVTVLAGVC